jgi:hypothetical protein
MVAQYGLLTLLITHVPEYAGCGVPAMMTVSPVAIPWGVVNRIVKSEPDLLMKLMLLAGMGLAGENLLVVCTDGSGAEPGWSMGRHR